MEVFAETLFEYELSDISKNKNKNIVSTKGTNMEEIKRNIEIIGENILVYKKEDSNVMNEHDEFIFNSTQYIKVKDMYINKYLCKYVYLYLYIYIYISIYVYIPLYPLPFLPPLYTGSWAPC
jgi:hypothetical protein